MQATKQLNLRLPEELVFWIKNMAKKRHQSMNSYVLTELEPARVILGMCYSI